MRFQRISIYRGLPLVPLARPMRGFGLGSLPMRAITLSVAAAIFPVAAYGNILGSNGFFGMALLQWQNRADRGGVGGSVAGHPALLW